MTVLERLPLDWEQILKVWIVAVVSVFGFIIALNLLLRLSKLRRRAAVPVHLAVRRPHPLGMLKRAVFRRRSRMLGGA
jgi:hypothetical protein